MSHGRELFRGGLSVTGRSRTTSLLSPTADLLADLKQWARLIGKLTTHGTTAP